MLSSLGARSLPLSWPQPDLTTCPQPDPKPQPDRRQESKQTESFFYVRTWCYWLRNKFVCLFFCFLFYLFIYDQRLEPLFNDQRLEPSKAIGTLISFFALRPSFRHALSRPYMTAFVTVSDRKIDNCCFNAQSRNREGHIRATSDWQGAKNIIIVVVSSTVVVVSVTTITIISCHSIIID